MTNLPWMPESPIEALHVAVELCSADRAGASHAGAAIGAGAPRSRAGALNPGLGHFHAGGFAFSC
eukprot:10946577-Alexandrium_andersonii.AAC.1